METIFDEEKEREMMELYNYESNNIRQISEEDIVIK